MGGSYFDFNQYLSLVYIQNYGQLIKYQQVIRSVTLLCPRQTHGPTTELRYLDWNI